MQPIGVNFRPLRGVKIDIAIGLVLGVATTCYVIAKPSKEEAEYAKG